MFLLQIKRTEGIEINSSGRSGKGQWGSSSCIVRAKKGSQAVLIFLYFLLCAGFSFLVSFVCLFFPPFCLLCLDFVLPVYIEYTSAAAAFSFFPPVCSGHCDGMCVCVCELFKFFFMLLDDAHLNSWLLADFIVFNETDSSRICCSLWLLCTAPALSFTASFYPPFSCLLRFSISVCCCLSGLQITRHLFSSGHSLKPI